MSDSKDKNVKVVDKLVMGLIVGGAVGSVLGMAFAPKTGKETRKIIKKKAEELSGEFHERAEEIKERAMEMKEDFLDDHEEQVLEAKELLANKSKGFLGLLREMLTPRRVTKKAKKPVKKSTGERK